MTNETLQETSALIRGPFELEPGQEPATEAELLAFLSNRIEDMLAHRPEYLMSLLYRLDVLEPKINKALHIGAPDPAHIGLAKLVLERQLQRVETKRTVKPAPLQDWEEWTL